MASQGGDVGLRPPISTHGRTRNTSYLLGGIALIAGGILTVVGSSLRWLTVTTRLNGPGNFVISRVNGVHYTNVGSTTGLGVGWLTILLAVAAAGGHLLWRARTCLSAIAALVCGALIAVAAVWVATEISRRNHLFRVVHQSPVGTHIAFGLWLTLIGGSFMLMGGTVRLVARVDTDAPVATASPSQ